MSRIEEKLDEIMLKQESVSVDLATLSARIDSLKEGMEEWKNVQGILCDSRCVMLDKKVDKVATRQWQILFWAVTTLLLGGGAILVGCNF